MKLSKLQFQSLVYSIGCSASFFDNKTDIINIQMHDSKMIKCFTFHVTNKFGEVFSTHWNSINHEVLEVALIGHEGNINDPETFNMETNDYNEKLNQWLEESHQRFLKEQ